MKSDSPFSHPSVHLLQNHRTYKLGLKPFIPFGTKRKEIKEKKKPKDNLINIPN